MLRKRKKDVEKNQGIIIGSIDYKEKSKIVYLYTPTGKDSVKALSAKTLKAGNLGFTTTLNVVSYVKTINSFPTLVEYSVLESFYSYTQSLKLMKIVTIILKVIYAIPEDSTHERIYPFIIDTFEKLNCDAPEKVLAIFLIKMLNVFGVKPSFKTCTRCGNNIPAGFSVSDGGMLCVNCLNKTQQSYNEYLLWSEYYFKKGKIEEYSECNLNDLLNKVYTYYAIHCNLSLKKEISLK